MIKESVIINKRKLKMRIGNTYKLPKQIHYIPDLTLTNEKLTSGIYLPRGAKVFLTEISRYT